MIEIKDGLVDISVFVTFTRPIIEGVTKVPSELGYVVLMDKLPNRFPNGIESFKMHFLNYLDSHNLQQGYPYNLVEDFPIRVLNSLRILKLAGCIKGYDIDDRGIISYCEEDEDD